MHISFSYVCLSRVHEATTLKMDSFLAIKSSDFFFKFSANQHPFNSTHFWFHKDSAYLRSCPQKS